MKHFILTTLFLFSSVTFADNTDFDLAMSLLDRSDDELLQLYHRDRKAIGEYIGIVNRLSEDEKAEFRLKVELHLYEKFKKEEEAIRVALLTVNKVIEEDNLRLYCLGNNYELILFSGNDDVCDSPFPKATLSQVVKKCKAEEMSVDACRFHRIGDDIKRTVPKSLSLYHDLIMTNKDYFYAYQTFKMGYTLRVISLGLAKTFDMHLYDEGKGEFVLIEPRCC